MRRVATAKNGVIDAINTMVLKMAVAIVSAGKIQLIMPKA
ncbi:hypothetical protein HMPREF3214_01391 [Alloscardovia omnicolens]|uniref:Uncharacterized protein n=1 Tax=Alloscardovia omnicolens F0580 TaxID=1321816 RepID=U1RD38_9BIFI|nr:hypothetical protein HMPREF9244_00399 [Alloscardovia omnicolens F0580]KWZ73320.1 hypothetical protein HMPREF3214_01391 [Alloscardovia omnicolens]